MVSFSLDKDEWHPPPMPLTADLIQRGQSPIFHVKNEKASNPFGSEFEHWSALPALSYFALNAVTFRESSRRIAGPTKFKPPPRVTLSDVRKQNWLLDLKNRKVPLRKLSRSVPHGFSGLTLLKMLIENNVPVNRAVWFSRIIGTNEVRALKRKAGLNDMERNEHVEASWLNEWTDAVAQVIVYVIEQFDQCEKLENDFPTEDATMDSEIEDDLFGDTTNVDNSTMQKDSTIQIDSITNNEHSLPTNEDQSKPLTNADATFPASDRTPILAGHNKGKCNEGEQSTAAATKPIRREQQPQEHKPKLTIHVWQERIQLTTRLVLAFYSEVLLDRQRLLDWLLDKLKSADVPQLPCFVHFVQLLWEPLASDRMGPKLIRSLAFRIKDNSVSHMMEPLLFKLMSTNENTFVAPRTWPLVESHLRTHPAYHRLADRNQAFMTQDPHDPSDWSHPFDICQLIDNFSRPYNVDDLLSQINRFSIDTNLLIHTLISRTVRQGTSTSVVLCISLLKRLVTTTRVVISDVCVDEVLALTKIYDSTFLTALICELIRARMFNLNLYVSRLISRDLLVPTTKETTSISTCLQGDDLIHVNELHLLVLHNLPFDWLNASLRTQIYMILKRCNEPVVPADLDPLVEQAKLMLEGDSSSTDISYLRLNDRYRLAENLVQLFESAISDNNSACEPFLDKPAVFVRLCELIEKVSPGNVRSLARLFALAVSSEKSGPVMVSCVLRQVHVRLMAFVCSGLMDSFVERLVIKLERCIVENFDLDSEFQTKEASFANTSTKQSRISDTPESLFQWLSWDDIVAIRSAIQSPGIMFDLNRLIPLRPAPNLVVSAGHTPVEHDSVFSALHKPGSPDIGLLLTMRGEVGLAHEIVNYSQTPGADKTALLQLVAHGAVTIDDLMKSSHVVDFKLLRFLILAPGNELGFCFEEVEALQIHRQQFLEHLEQTKLLELCSSVPPSKFVSRMAHVFPDIYMNRIIFPSKDLSLFARYQTSSRVCPLTFELMLVTCTPFNLRFFRGVTVLNFRDLEPSKAAQEIVDTAYKHPEASQALQGLLQNIDSKVKNIIFTKTVERFFGEDLGSISWAHLTVHSTLIRALARSLVEPLAWSLDQVPQFLDRLVNAAKNDDDNALYLRKVLILVLRISVIGRLHNKELPSAAVPYLETLRHVQAFADNHRTRTIIEDALRLLLRISAPIENRFFIGQRHLLAQSGFSDGLLLYSKSCDEYSPLPIWSFDLIEDASLLESNDGPVDLLLFEAYKD